MSSIPVASSHSPLTRFTPPAEQAGAGDTSAAAWPQWQLILFRFFFAYFVLRVEPWNWFAIVPGFRIPLRYYGMGLDWVVRWSNAHFFHVRERLVPVNGSGDTSWAWTELQLLLVTAAVVCVVWSLLDRKRCEYDRLAFWLRMIVRYYVASAALSYGIIKLFLLQMPFPSLSQLATPLGDLLPMRFSWLFIGYSATYQFFSGAMETMAGLLLLYRRTVTAGLFAATGAFMNVVMINLAYDVPVKLYAMHLLFSCLFLLALDSKRLVNLLVLNRGVEATTAYVPAFKARWQRWGSVAVKLLLIYEFLVLPLQNGWTRYQFSNRVVPGPFTVGVYDVRKFVVNRDSVGVASRDTLRWNDMIIDGPNGGSIATKDTVFWQRYGRAYFRFAPLPERGTLAVWKISAIPRDSTFLFKMRYETPDTNTIRLHTAIRGDSIHVELVRVPRHFQLTERQFHWVSEYNR